MSKILFYIASFLCCSPAVGSVIISFANNDSFEGDVATDSAGPFTDPDTGFSGSITTQAVSPSGVLNPNAGTFGINAAGGGDTAGSFDAGEFWTFSWDIATEWEGIDFGSFSTNTEEFAISSNDFINLGITPTSSEIQYDSSSGTFTFAPGSASDDFDLTDLSGGTILNLGAGSDFTIAFAGPTDNATLQGLTFAITIPEPASIITLALLTYLGLSYHRQKRLI